MNKAEAKILHGLYFHREMIGEEMIYTAAEINWLINASFEEGSNWQTPEGGLQSLEADNENYLASISATSAASQRPIQYLKEKGYITCKINGNFRISITAEGADLARELHTRMGRLNILYKKHKDGAIWLLLTILVSLITSLLTKCGK